MDEEVSIGELREVSKLLADRMALHFPEGRLGDLQRAMETGAKQLGFSSGAELTRKLLDSQLTEKCIQALATFLTIGETYFFRDAALFQALESQILPELIERRRSTGKMIRIWSAGCCTGEEPYSLAIVLSRLLATDPGWKVTLLATDINPEFLHKAREAVFSDWSFRDTPERVKERYFTPVDGNRFQLQPSYRQMVTFENLNLADDSYPSLVNGTNAMDLILCRNVLMYFTMEQRQKVASKFFNALIEGGCLIVSATETGPTLFQQFTAEIVRGVTVYRRKQRAQPSPPSKPRQFGLEFPSQTQMHLESPAAPRIQPSATPVAREAVANDRFVRFARARALYEQGCHEDAAEILRALIDRGDRDVEILALLTRSCANAGQLDEALTCCDAALRDEKSSSELHYLRATILQEQGNLDEASASLKRAIYLDPGFVIAHFALANLAIQSGRVAEAERGYRNALTLARKLRPEAVLQCSEGITAARMAELITSTLIQEEIR